jgi:CxxC motif-containing protein
LEIDGERVSGNWCDKGLEFARQEMTNPLRILTATVRVQDGEYPVVSVRSMEPVPKSGIREIIKRLNEVTLSAPVHAGDNVMENIITTKNVEKHSHWRQ